VAGFVPEKDHEIMSIIRGIAHLTLKPDQPVIGKVKGNPDDRHAVRATPLIAGAGEIVGRSEKDLLGLKFYIKLLETAI